MAETLLQELLSQRLEVVLVPVQQPTHEGHMRRVVCGQNPDWYQTLCARHSSGRRDISRWAKQKTRIKRKDVTMGLQALSAGMHGRCVNLLLPIIRQRLAMGGVA